MGFGRYLVYRLVNAFIVLFFVVLLTSILFVRLYDINIKTQITSQVQMEWMQYQKAHPGTTVNGTEWMAQRTKALYHKYHLDVPYWERVWELTIKTMKFDFGNMQIQIFGTYSAKEAIKLALPRTVLLFTTATIITILLGIFLGVKSAQNPGGSLDKVISVLAMLTTSLPMWWVGMLMILVVVVKLQWLPINLYATVSVSSFGQLLTKMTLPVFTIVLVSFGGWSWIIRNIMIGTLQEDFILVARAKGVPERKVIYGHGLRASAPPIITMIIFALLGSFSGAIITEVVFNWPGMGRLYWVAITQNAVNLVVGLTYIFTLLYLLSMILADLMYAWLDPRVKVGASTSV